MTVRLMTAALAATIIGTASVAFAPTHAQTLTTDRPAVSDSALPNSSDSNAPKSALKTKTTISRAITLQQQPATSGEAPKMMAPPEPVANPAR
jgi:hypothetical protein